MLVLGSTVSKTILNFHRRFFKIFILLFCVFYGTCWIFCYTIFLVLNPVHELSLRQTFLWTFVFPVNLFLVNYHLFWAPVFMMIATQCVFIRQNVAVDQLNKLKLKLMKYNNNLNKSLAKYFSLNRSIVGLCKDIDYVSQFWTPFLTAFFFNFISCQSYLVYTVFIVNDVIFLGRAFIFYGLCEMTLVQFALLHHCAKVAKGSRKIEIVNRKLFLLFLSKGAFSNNNIADKLFILKVNFFPQIFCYFNFYNLG